MNWEQYRLVMEKYAIKTDDMATEDAYFMATHMPFSQLEVYQGGRTSVPPKIWSEDRVFEELVCNPNDEHRLVIVRGDNGTGKSHLIRYLRGQWLPAQSPGEGACFCGSGRCRDSVRWYTARWRAGNGDRSCPPALWPSKRPGPSVPPPEPHHRRENADSRRQYGNFPDKSFPAYRFPPSVYLL